MFCCQAIICQWWGSRSPLSLQAQQEAPEEGKKRKPIGGGRLRFIVAAEGVVTSHWTEMFDGDVLGGGSVSVCQ